MHWLQALASDPHCMPFLLTHASGQEPLTIFCGGSNPTQLLASVFPLHSHIPSPLLFIPHSRISSQPSSPLHRFGTLLHPPLRFPLTLIHLPITRAHARRTSPRHHFPRYLFPPSSVRQRANALAQLMRSTDEIVAWAPAHS